MRKLKYSNISKDAKTLKDKASLLKGYVKLINSKTNIVKEIKKINK